MSAATPAIKYVGYYDTESNQSEKRGYVLAATHKMDYIIASLNGLGFDVHVVSASITRNRRGHSGKLVSIGNRNRLVLLPTLPWGGKVRRVLSVVWSRILLLSWLLTNTTAGENVIVYHSLGYTRTILIAKALRRFRLILEVEEVYGDVTGKWIDRWKEYALFRQADAFIFPTQMLSDKLNRRGNPHVVVHGTYGAEP
ncbi:MAG: glycosyltransferase, partial [Coriobacteriia bacterium]|nr:glycosyltransferase [Coriobacteriia bacterium]